MKKYLLLSLFFCFLACRTEKSPTTETTSIQGPIGEKAMVSTAHPEATKIGVDILKKGGNAVDAAIAVQFALAVSYPIAGNIGGGGFMVLRLANGEVNTLDFREIAPIAAYRDMYLDEEGEVVPNSSVDGRLAVGIPGTVDGCVEAHKKYGSLPFKDLIQPAIELAEQGFILSKRQANRFQKFVNDFQTFNPQNDYFRKAGGWKGGDTIIQTDLSETLARIRDHGRAGFYEGPTADMLIEEMQTEPGIIIHEDLKKYRSKWRKPVSGQYKNYTIHSMAPPSSGGVLLLQMLEILSQYPLKEWGHNSVESTHLIVETERRVYADRAAHLGDPDFYEVPTTGLLDKKYILNRMNNFNPKKATRSLMVREGKPLAESTETTHFSIVDPFGNAVSVTTTLNGAYGSKVCVNGAGFFLNNEMDDFSIKPGVPNSYGLVGGKANAIKAGKRMLSSMTPSIMEKDGQLFMVVGSPGGSTIITSVLQTFLNVVEYDMGMQEAVNAGRIHHQWLPDTIFIEKQALKADVQAQLSTMEHRLKEREPIGRVDAILILADGKLEGGADRRGEDIALGF